MQSIIESKNPKNGLSKQACQQLVQDILTTNHEDIISIPWLSQAILEYQSHPKISQFRVEHQSKIQDMIQFLNQQFKSVVVFGWDAQWMNEITEIVQKFKYPVDWIIPGLSNQKMTVAVHELALIPDLVLSSNLSEFVVNQCMNQKDEIQLVINHLKDRTDQPLLVVPNQQIMQQIEFVAAKLAIHIDTQAAVPLSKTKKGEWLIALIAYINQPTVSSLTHLVALSSPQLNKGLKTIIANIQHHAGVKLASSAVLPLILKNIPKDHPFQHILSLKSLEEIQLFWQNQSNAFTTDKAGYHAYQTHHQIQDILNEAVQQKKHPFKYVQFLLKYRSLTLVQSDARIRCIAPESIARYFDQPIWVMGFGEWSWSKPKKAGYLSVEQLGQSDIDNHCRRAFGHWALTHPKLLGVSYAGTIDGKQNFPLEGMPVISKPVQLIKKNQQPLQRSAAATVNPTTVLKSSPSKLQHYQKCPYSYYLHHVLGIKNTSEKQTDSQIMGILIHDAIEQIIKTDGSVNDDLSLHLNTTLTPLIADSLKKRIQDQWPLTDFISFCVTDGGKIKTEIPLSLDIDGHSIEGRADVLVTRPDSIAIIDIKTGQLPTKVAVKTFEDVQLGLYIWMLNQTKQVSAHYFTKNNTLKTMLDSADDDFLELFSAFKGRIKTIIKNIQSGMFSPEQAMVKTNVQANTCRTCNYYSICHYPERHQR